MLLRRVMLIYIYLNIICRAWSVCNWGY